jgi:hypothetical protein
MECTELGPQCIGCAHGVEIHDVEGCQHAIYVCPCSMTPDEIAFVRAHRNRRP